MLPPNLSYWEYLIKEWPLLDSLDNVTYPFSCSRKLEKEVLAAIQE